MKKMTQRQAKQELSKGDRKALGEEREKERREIQEGMEFEGREMSLLVKEDRSDTAISV